MYQSSSDKHYRKKRALLNIGKKTMNDEGLAESQITLKSTVVFL